MINIVIFSGGTESIAIQEGFSTRYGIDSYNLDVIINGYDNGKSTGACRKIFNDRILGPSDLRKESSGTVLLTHSLWAWRRPGHGGRAGGTFHFDSFGAEYDRHQ